MNFGVVILNYMAYQTTIDCIESFMRQDLDSNKMEIVIVDNASPNESFEVLKNKYCSEQSIHVVKMQQNVGFANGNNFGYFEIKKMMKPDFVIISNNDIILKQDKLFDWIQHQYENSQFAVLGPSVYSVNGKFYQSPMNNLTKDINKCKKNIRKLFFMICKAYIKKAVHYPLSQSQSGIVAQNVYEKETTKKTLHGSFQIFSNRYFEKYNEPYDPRTFLYLEEDILRLRCEQSNLIMLYSPEYEVNHLQAVATSMKDTNSYDRIIHRLKYQYHSQIVYLDVVKNYKQNHRLI